MKNHYTFTMSVSTDKTVSETFTALFWALTPNSPNTPLDVEKFHCGGATLEPFRATPRKMTG